VEADTVSAFKYRLDKHWSDQESRVVFDFNADLTGTGSVVYQFVCDHNAM